MKTITALAMAAIEAGEAIVTGAVDIDIPITRVWGDMPYYVGSGALAATSGGPPLVPYPTGLEANDILFLNVFDYDALDPATIDTPVGWEEVDEEPVFLTGYRHAVFWKRATGLESGTVALSSTPTNDVTDTFGGVMSAYRGALSTDTPFEGLQQNTDQSEHMEGSAVTTTDINRLILHFCTHSNPALGVLSFATPATGWLERYDHSTGAGNEQGGAELYERPAATAGTTPAAEHTLDAVAVYWQVMSLALLPELSSDPPGSSNIRLWGGYGTIEIEGDTYQGVGARGLAQQTAGAIGGVAQGLTLTLSGLEPEALSLLDADEIKGQAVVLRRLIFANDGKTLLGHEVWDRGRVDAVETSETIGGDAAINVAVESAARGLGRSGARQRSDSDQRLISLTDGYFKNTAYAGEKMLYWGGKKPTKAGTAVGGSSGGSLATGDSFTRI